MRRGAALDGTHGRAGRFGDLFTWVEGLTKPSAELVATRGLCNFSHHVPSIFGRRGSNDVAQGDFVEEERYAADFKAVLAQLASPKLLGLRVATVRGLRGDDEVGPSPPDRFLMDRLPCPAGHRPPAVELEPLRSTAYRSQ